MFYIIINTLVICTFFVVAMILKCWTSKIGPNYLVGFRTETSVSSPEIWRESQILASKYMVKAGSICIIPVIITSFLVYTYLYDYLLVLTMIIGALFTAINFYIAAKIDQKFKP